MRWRWRWPMSTLRCTHKKQTNKKKKFWRLYTNRKVTVWWTPGGVRQWTHLCSNSCFNRKEARRRRRGWWRWQLWWRHLTWAKQCLWVISGVCLNALERSSWMESTASPGQISQMSFHDVRRQTSVTERLQMSEMCRTFKPKSNLKVVFFFFLSVMKHNQALCERFNDPPLPLWVLLWMNNNDHRPETNTADGRLRSDSWSEKSGEAAF